MKYIGASCADKLYLKVEDNYKLYNCNKSHF